MACADKTWLIVLIVIASILTLSIIFILSYTLIRYIASLKANRWNIKGLMAHFDPFWPILTHFGDNYSHIGYNGFDIKWWHWWRPFKIYHLVSTANPALCGWNWAGLYCQLAGKYINPPAPRICHHSYVKGSLMPPFLCLIFSLQLVW